MSSENPLFEFFIWILKSFKALTLNKIIRAPYYYDEWWRRLLRESPHHVIIETTMICFIIWLMFIRQTVDPKKYIKNDKLSQKEIDELVDTWYPEPLVPKLTVKSETLANSMMIIESVDGNYVKIRGVENPVLNLGSFDFLGLSHFSSIKDVAEKALDKYGCGSCGPRGFYGTIDQHLFIENAVAKFLGVEEAISYSDGASAVSSSIPAFSKKGDLILVDEACWEPILTGVNLSRSTVQFFKHNDMDDLKALLMSIEKDDIRLKRDATQQRRFIVVEGLYHNTGDLCPLPTLLNFKNQFCYRLILDETLSFGTIGKTGRGVTEHFGVPIAEIDIITVAMDTALASVGGLCVGTREVCDHQRLSGAGYCFSASAPPFLSAAAVQALQELEGNPQLVQQLTDNAQSLFRGLQSVAGIRLLAAEASPVLHFSIVSASAQPLSREREEVLVQRLAEDCVRRGIGAVCGKFPLAGPSARASRLQPSVRLCASAALSQEQIKHTIEQVSAAVANLLL